MAKEKKDLAVAVMAHMAKVIENTTRDQTEVELPEGFEGGKEVSSFAPVVEFDAPGAYIAGYFVSAKDHVGPNDSRLYLLELPKTKEVVAIWGSTVLDGKIMSSGIRPGGKIMIQRIEDIPSKKGGQSPAKNFRVMLG